MRLPVRDPARVGDAAAEGALVNGRLHGYTVVAVDDDADTRELLQAVLGGAGARVHAAASASEALALCRVSRPDALVSDIAMPGKDGYSLLRDLQAAFGPGVPRVAIALSAYASVADQARAATSGFHRHMAKPFDPADLVDALEQLLKDDEASAV